MTEAEVRVSELDNVVGFDLETSGLDEQGDQILEVAAVFGGFVDGAFVERRRFCVVLPIQSNVEEWHPVVLEMHTKNGLFVEAMAERKRYLARERSQPAVETVDKQLVHAAPALPFKQKWTMLGNSVHFDLRFVRRLFPLFAGQCSHRVIDVSSIRLFCESLGRPYVKGEVAHRAMPDVEASLREFAACRAWIHNTIGVDASDYGDTFRQDIADRDALANVVGHGAG